MDDSGLGQGLDDLLVVMLVAALAPIVVGLLPRLRIPQVVVFILGGVLAGPELLGWADAGSIELLANVGLGFLFLLAGYELDPGLLRTGPGRLAMLGWVVSLTLAAVVTAGLYAVGFVDAYAPVALALTTTALGTLLPILRENDMLGGVLGRYVFASGAVGELFPIIAVAVFLGTQSKLVALVSLASVGLLALVLTLVPRLVRGGRVERIIREGQNATAQTTLRWSIVLLILLLVVANDFGLDVVLGAFLAGMVLRRWAPGEAEALEAKLDAVAYGFFIPVFFVSSGIGLDVDSIVRNPGRLAVFFVLLLVIRGLPTLVIYRGPLPRRERVELTFLTATTLPMLVALTRIGLANGTMLPENAAALVGAGVLSILVFPGIAVRLHRRGREPVPAQREAPDRAFTSGAVRDQGPQ